MSSGGPPVPHSPAPPTRAAFPGLRLLPAGTSAAHTPAWLPPPPLSPRVAWCYQHRGRESSRRGRKRVDRSSGRCSSPPPRPRFFFTSFNLQGKDFINMKRSACPGSQARLLLAGLSGAGPCPPLQPPRRRPGFRRPCRAQGASRVRSACGDFSPGLLPR